jgi:hypothetical protein
MTANSDARYHVFATRIASILLLAALGSMIATLPLRAQPCSGSNTPCVVTSQYDSLRQGYNQYESYFPSVGLKDIIYRSTSTELPPA